MLLRANAQLDASMGKVGISIYLRIRGELLSHLSKFAIDLADFTEREQ